MNSCEIISYRNQKIHSRTDTIASEAILSIEIIWGPPHNRTKTHLADLLRTPGHDYELALGLIFSLGIITSINNILSYNLCPRRTLITFELDYKLEFKPQNFSSGHMRHAGCGFCTSPQNLPKNLTPVTNNIIINAEIILACESKLKPAQQLFAQTGGTHAAALFDKNANLITLYEDVGRHNALDKLLGFKLINPKTESNIVIMSSRASFELLQKAHMAKLPIIITLGAVSTMALDYAKKYHITLGGFLSSTGFNIYTHKDRIKL